MPNEALLESRAINAWRGDFQVLKDVSFAVRAGEFVQVVGPNGVGKTTLLRVLCGLFHADSGNVLWRGEPVRNVLGTLCQELTFLGHQNAVKSDLTAVENLAFLSRLKIAVTHAECMRALDRVGLLSRAALPARALSAGQRRRLALARLALQPAALWILDEPATNLDVQGVALVESLIAEQLARGGIVVAAAHQRLLAADPRTRTLELGA